MGYHSCLISPFGLLPISLGFPDQIALLLPLVVPMSLQAIILAILVHLAYYLFLWASLTQLLYFYPFYFFFLPSFLNAGLILLLDPFVKNGHQQWFKGYEAWFWIDSWYLPTRCVDGLVRFIAKGCWSNLYCTLWFKGDEIWSQIFSWYLQTWSIDGSAWFDVKGPWLDFELNQDKVEEKLLLWFGKVRIGLDFWMSKRDL